MRNGDLVLVDVSLRQPGRDGKCGVIDFSIVTPAAKFYSCVEAAKTPLYTTNLREEAKMLKYFQAYKQLNDKHFEMFVVENGEANSQEILLQEDLQSYHPSIFNSVFLEVETPCHYGENHALQSTQIGNGTQRIQESRY